MKLNATDWMIIISIVMILTAHAATNIVVGKLSESYGERATDMLKVIESSPAARVSFQFKQVGTILSYIMVPALIGGVYYSMRRREFGDKKDKEFALTGFAGIMFVAGLLNVVNDLSILVGVLI